MRRIASNTQIWDKTRAWKQQPHSKGLSARSFRTLLNYILLYTPLTYFIKEGPKLEFHSFHIRFETYHKKLWSTLICTAVCSRCLKSLSLLSFFSYVIFHAFVKMKKLSTWETYSEWREKQVTLMKKELSEQWKKRFASVLSKLMNLIISRHKPENREKPFLFHITQWILAKLKSKV